MQRFQGAGIFAQFTDIQTQNKTVAKTGTCFEQKMDKTGTCFIKKTDKNDTCLVFSGGTRMYIFVFKIYPFVFWAETFFIIIR